MSLSSCDHYGQVMPACISVPDTKARNDRTCATNLVKLATCLPPMPLRPLGLTTRWNSNFPCTSTYVVGSHVTRGDAMLRDLGLCKCVCIIMIDSDRHRPSNGMRWGPSIQALKQNKLGCVALVPRKYTRKFSEVEMACIPSYVHALVMIDDDVHPSILLALVGQIVSTCEYCYTRSMLQGIGARVARVQNAHLGK